MALAFAASVTLIQGLVAVYSDCLIRFITVTGEIPGINALGKHMRRAQWVKAQLFNNIVHLLVRDARWSIDARGAAVHDWEAYVPAAETQKAETPKEATQGYRTASPTSAIS